MQLNRSRRRRTVAAAIATATQHTCNMTSTISTQSSLCILIVLATFIASTLARPQIDSRFETNYAVDFDAPLITPLKEEIILQMNTDYSIRCEGKEEVVWLQPDFPDDPLPADNFTTTDSERPYGIIHHLVDASYANVGYYYCVHKSKIGKNTNLANLKESLEASSIYVYVNDTNSLLAPMNVLIHGVQKQSVTMPCKPVMPDIVVTLTGDQKQMKMDIYERYGKLVSNMSKLMHNNSNETTNVRYDAREGFIFHALSFNGTYYYTCAGGNTTFDFEFTALTSTEFINKPTITSTSRGHAYEGDSFQLVCTVETSHGVRYTMPWTVPDGIDENRIEKSNSIFDKSLGDKATGTRTLTVFNAKESDSGNYRCTVTDQSNNSAYRNYHMKVMKKGDSYLNMSEPNDHYTITISANQTMTMTVTFRGHPWPTLTWFKPDGTIILSDTDDLHSTIHINNATMSDSGEYRVVAENGNNKVERIFKANVQDKPVVEINDVYVGIGEVAQVTCSVKSIPTATIAWMHQSCSMTPHWPTCEKFNMTQINDASRKSRPGMDNTENIYDLFYTPPGPGYIICSAFNKQGKDIGKAQILISDIKGNMSIYGVNESKKIGRGDKVNITCAALVYHFSDDLKWFKDNVEVTANADIEIENDRSEYSYKKTLIFDNIQYDNQGHYECRTKYIDDPEKEIISGMNITVYEPLIPVINSTNLKADSKIDLKLGELLELICVVEAIPEADTVWYKDDVPIRQSDHVKIEENNSKLNIAYIRPEDEGVYKCVATNRLGSSEASATVRITDLPGLTLGWILGLLFFFIILIGLVIYLCLRVHHERKLARESGLANFVEGAVEQINPALTLDEQADLLPYDRHFEFPREKLKLGKQLGAGAFGVVLKAYAEGIKPEEKESIVAVKMVKRTADNEVMRALVSELKIMVHLGQHLNVVNLLGAVTKNIAKRELMVIVEFCRFGNVQNFLLRNRKRFINQVHPETDRIDSTIMVQRISDNFEHNRSPNNGVKYVNLTFSNHQYINHMNSMNNNNTMNNHRNSDNDPRSGTRAGRPNSSGYVRQSEIYEGHMDSCATEQTIMTTVPDEDALLSNNSVQPAWRSNYKSDSTEAMTVTTSDLVSWAFQVARGMDYLSSRKVLHGDLAARNILLCENNIVKICDFGLARSMYKSDNYKKQGEAPLPIKWLALESLSDHVFSTYTDVWSFGIVLWEFFSLAKVPYPGIDPNQSLYIKLKDGYRMEKPPFANDELYDIMLECWSTNPECRPLFNVLEKRFARMLGDEVSSHYMDLNEPYLRSNSEYMRRNQTDYLALMGSPDEMAPPPPRYVNGHILPEIRIQASSDDYLQMSPSASGTATTAIDTTTTTTIFSPTRPKDDENDPNTTTSFTFPDPVPQDRFSPTLINNMDDTSNKSMSKNGVAMQPEEIPMLYNANQRTSESDNDGSPEQGRKFSNILQQMRTTPTPSPRHHIAETKLSTDDNYVNVKSPTKKYNGSDTRKADAFSNPSYNMLKTLIDTPANT